MREAEGEGQEQEPEASPTAGVDRGRGQRGARLSAPRATIAQNVPTLPGGSPTTRLGAQGHLSFTPCPRSLMACLCQTVEGMEEGKFPWLQ